MTQVKLHTNHDGVTLTLNAKEAPKSVINFVVYMKDGHYNGTAFHHVIENLMIQDGGFEPGEEMSQKPVKAPIDSEASNSLKSERNAIAMARTNDPYPATAQFFANTVDNGFPNHTSPTSQGWGYAMFDRVIEGMDVVDGIRSMRAGNRSFHQDVSLEDVIIESTGMIE